MVNKDEKTPPGPKAPTKEQKKKKIEVVKETKKEEVVEEEEEESVPVEEVEEERKAPRGHCIKECELLIFEIYRLLGGSVCGCR